jgi:hypothetical protein
MKKLINQVDDVVLQQMEGLALSRPELKANYEPRYMWHEETPGQQQKLNVDFFFLFLITYSAKVGTSFICTFSDIL